MADYTTNYNLKKPLLTEKYNIDDQNGNMDILDTEIKKFDTQMAELAKVHNATGTDAFVISTGGDFDYTDGAWIKFKVSANNTGAVTIDIDGKGVKSLKNPDGTILVAGDLEAGVAYEAFYSLGDDFFVLRPRGAKLDSIISAIESKGGTVAGPQKVTEIESAINNVANWDADLVAANIRDSVDVFGVIGTLIEGKKWASGILTSSSTTKTLYLTDNKGVSTSKYYITLYNLDFQPSYGIIISNAPGSTLADLCIINAVNTMVGTVDQTLVNTFFSNNTSYGIVNMLGSMSWNFYVDVRVTYARLPVSYSNHEYVYILFE